MRAGAGIANLGVQRVTVRARSAPRSAPPVSHHSELQTSLSPLSLRAILIKSPLVGAHCSPAGHWAGSLLIPVAPGPGRAFVPVWRIFACVDVLPCAVTGARGLEGAVGSRAVFLLVFPPYPYPFPCPSLTLQTSSGSQRGWGQRERRETEIGSFRGSSSSGRPCQEPALHTSSSPQHT